MSLKLSEIKFALRGGVLILLLVLSKLDPTATLSHFSDKNISLNFKQELKDITKGDLIFKQILLK